MTIKDKGWSVLSNGTSLYKISRSENLPCCTMVAMWVLDVTDYVNAKNVNEYSKVDINWWKKANVFDREDPWSALTAAQKKLGGTLEYRSKVSNDAPKLTSGRWHIIQRWRNLDLNNSGLEDDIVTSNSSGHTYLAYCTIDNKVIIIQSSIAKGFRQNDGIWEKGAGLDGFSVGVLTLPE